MLDTTRPETILCVMELQAVESGRLIAHCECKLQHVNPAEPTTNGSKYTMLIAIGPMSIDQIFASSVADAIKKRIEDFANDLARCTHSRRTTTNEPEPAD